MLDQLVESRSYKGENRRRGGFLLTTFLSVCSLLAAGFVYSLFNHAMAMGNENLDFSSLVAPVAIAAEAPPEAPAPAPKTTSDRQPDKAPVRQENQQRIEEAPVAAPDVVSTTANTKMSRPPGRFNFGPVDSDPVNAGGNSRGDRTGNGNSQSTGIGTTATEPEEKDVDPPAMKPVPKPEVKKAPTIVSRGVINGQAKNLVIPQYPLPAKAVHAEGEVKVQIVIDEEGNVISANAVSGHPLLKLAAVNAARSSKFTPTFLSEQKVKVNGFIVYNFKAQ